MRHHVTYRVAFLMDQVAGHITNARNLKRVVDTADDILPEWFEISYYRAGGTI